MSVAFYALCLSIIGQVPVAAVPAQELKETSPVPVASSRLHDPKVQPVAEVFEDNSGALPTPPAPLVQPNGAAMPAPVVTGEYSPAVAEAFQNTRAMFQSDHAFDGFTGPMSNFVQFKDPRVLTEARLTVMNNFNRANTPVVGGGTIQVYALQLRLALSERLQLFADKDGIVRVSPKGGRSFTGLANINAGLKYAFIRDVENQFIFSGVLQYEPPTGGANVFQRNGDGLLGVYGVVGKQFADNWHVLFQFGENIAVNNKQNGYFMSDLHVDRRMGKLTPFYEANWFYYNQPGTNLPLGIEGGGLVNLGSKYVNGMNYLTNAFGIKYDLTKNLELGVCYEFQVSNRTQLLNNMILTQLIWRY